MLKKSTALKITAVLLSAEAFVQHDAVALALADMQANTDDLAPFGLQSAALLARLPAAVIVPPLALALFSELVHSELLAEDTRAGGVFEGGAFEAAMGNLAVALCELAGLDLEQADTDGYCLKATPAEICLFNIQTIDQHMVQAELCPA